MINLKTLIGTLAIATPLTTAPAFASVVVLDFENIAPYPNDNDVLIQEFYNGGTSSIGTSGTNFGVSFSGNSILLCLNTPGVDCSNTSRGGLGNPSSRFGGLFFESGAATSINVAAGFDTGFSFYYSAPFASSVIEVYDDLNATGNVLQSINLPQTSSTCTDEFGNPDYCPLVPVGVTFNGIARSVAFGIGATDLIAFDDITFGSEIPGVVPEPLTILGASAAVAFGAAFKRRKAQ